MKCHRESEEATPELCCLLIFNYQTRPKTLRVTRKKGRNVAIEPRNLHLLGHKRQHQKRKRNQKKRKEWAHKKRKVDRERQAGWAGELVGLPTVGTSCWIIQQMSWQHFNLSLRFVGRLDKELDSGRGKLRRVLANSGASWPVLFTLCCPPNDKRTKLIENFVRCVRQHWANKTNKNAGSANYAAISFWYFGQNWMKGC